MLDSAQARPVGPTTTWVACALSNNVALPILDEEHYVLVAGRAGDQDVMLLVQDGQGHVVGQRAGAAGARDERGWETDLLAGLEFGAAPRR
ncbi:hypothetical protein MAHJHV35_46750 [Mycobacterium avium subsp. hominissuis]